jgi:hypothetical protein
MKMNRTLIATLAGIAVLSFVGQVKAQFNAKSDDGIAASPKVRQMLDGRKAQAEVKTIKLEAATAMACDKCKSVPFRSVTTEKGHIKNVTIGEKHVCSGCTTTIGVAGVGKGKHDVVKHVCTAGNGKALCCAK